MPRKTTCAALRIVPSKAALGLDRGILGNGSGVE